MDTTTKINHFWRYLYIVFGLRISGDYSDFKPQICTACYFALICIVIALSNGTMITVMFLQQEGTIIYTVCMSMSILSVIVESTTCLVVLYRKQQEFSNFLKEILTPINQQFRKKVWICLLSLFISLWVCLSISTVAEIYSTIINLKKDEHEKSIPDSLEIYALIAALCWWLITQSFIRSSKIFFIHMCHLLSLHFESLSADVKQCLSCSLIANESVMNYQTKFSVFVEFVNKMNNLFHPLLAIWNVGDLVFICFAIRLMMFQTHFGVIVMVPLIRELFAVFILFYFAADVQSKAEFCATMIAKLTNYKKMLKSSAEISEEVIFNNWTGQMSVCQLSLNSVAINVSGFYNITKGSLLTMLATLLTYTVVLLQTSP